MDWMCLVGLCSAAAQVATEAAGAATAGSAVGVAEVATAASAPGAAASAPASFREDASWFVALVGGVSFVLAQWRAKGVIGRYARNLIGYMGTASEQALGLVGRQVRAPWTAESLFEAMERRRRAVLWTLVGVVAVYSSIAAIVLVAHAGLAGNARLSVLSISVSFLMFASFSAPVVLLGVSASNFNKLFWTYCAPATFATVAMQAMVFSISDAQERLSHVLWALFVVLLLTGAAVLARQTVPRERQRQGWAWLAAHPWSGGIALVLAAFVVLVGLGLSMRDTSFFYLVGGSVVGAAAIGMCYLTLIDRIKRIVAPLLGAGYSAAIAAFMLAAMGVSEGLRLPEEQAWLVMIASIAAGVAAGWLARSLMLSWIGVAYEQKVFSDAQFQVFCWMVAVSGVVISVGTLVRKEAQLFDRMNLWLLVATVLALASYWIVTRYLLQPLDSNKRLLVLRVFSRDRRGERLLDELEYRWRFIGPIVLIGGEDVAQRTIDPAKAANFLRGRLRDTFVPNAYELNKRVVAMDEAPDPDGRYRVNEFFCFDDTWKDAVRMLLDSSDAIVLDLTEFTAERRGTAYELGLLLERGALPRTVFLTSAMTDLDAVRAALKVRAGEALPAGGEIRIERSVDGRKLVELLLQRMRTGESTALVRPPALAA